MDFHFASTQTCILKMNLLCCEDCPNKLKKKLQKMNGVKKVNIDRRQGLVTVSSNIDPVILTEKIIKMGKRAELLSFQKDPITSQKQASSSSSSSKTKSYVQIGKDCSCEGHENTTTSDEDDYQNSPKNKNNSLLTWQRPEQSTKDKKKKKKVVTMPRPMPMPGTRPMMNSVGHMSFHGPFRPPYGWPPTIHRPPVQAAYANGYGPYGYYRPRPWAPTYSYYGSGSPPRVNPMTHYTSYEDNYRPH